MKLKSANKETGTIREGQLFDGLRHKIVKIVAEHDGKANVIMKAPHHTGSAGHAVVLGRFNITTGLPKRTRVSENVKVPRVLKPARSTILQKDRDGRQ